MPSSHTQLPAVPPALVRYNPSSGRGKGREVAEQLHARLLAAGHDCSLSTSLDDEPKPSTALRVLFIVGGDGTVHRSLDLARRHDLAIYHVPMGTENLFSREFGMTRDIALAVRSLNAPRFRTIDLATCSLAGAAPTTFAIMCSVGPDAAVIRRLSAARTGPIRHASYLAPIAYELLHLQLPPLTIDADGTTIVRGEPGMVVVANSRHYAMRLDPAHTADMSDGLLDLVFFPARTRVELLTHLLAARFRRARENPDVRHHRARHFRIASADPATAYQLDGEAGVPTPIARPFELHLRILPAAVRVLVPAHAHR